MRWRGDLGGIRVKQHSVVDAVSGTILILAIEMASNLVPDQKRTLAGCSKQGEGAG